MKIDVTTSDMGEAVITYEARSLAMNYLDGTIAFTANFILPNSPTSADRKEAGILVLALLKAYKVRERHIYIVHDIIYQ